MSTTPENEDLGGGEVSGCFCCCCCCFNKIPKTNIRLPAFYIARYRNFKLIPEGQFNAKKVGKNLRIQEPFMIKHAYCGTESLLEEGTHLIRCLNTVGLVLWARDGGGGRSQQAEDGRIH